MRETKVKRAPRPEFIQHPPVVFLADGEHVSDAMIAVSIENNTSQSTMMTQSVEPQVILKLIEYLEKKM